MPRAIVVLALLLACAGRVGAQVRYEFTELHLGVPVRVALYAPDDAAARAAARAAFARIVALEHKMSDYRADSELRGLERRPGEWVPVSAELFAVLARAVEIAQASAGAFDPTVGPLVALWRGARRSGRLPETDVLEAARRLVSWRKLELDSARQAVRLAMAGMGLDLGGIAKGYILDEALATLAAQGIGSALIAAGGDIAVGDAPPGAAGWRIETPYADSVVAARARVLAHAAIATSGASQQFVEIAGVRYSHVVDPGTGLGLTNAYTATVIARDGATADALATALTVLGPERGADLVARYPGTTASVRRP